MAPAARRVMIMDRAFSPLESFGDAYLGLRRSGFDLG